MMRKIVGIGLVATLVAGLTLFTACDEDEDDITNPDPCAGTTEITITSPADNATLKVGEAVTIDWCLPSDVSAVIVSYSNNDGETINKISQGEAIAAADATEMTWTPTIDDVSASMGILYVQNYNDQTGDYDMVTGLTVSAQ